MDITIRLSVFILMFTIVALAEYIWPRRVQNLHRIKRWPHNLLLSFLNVVIVWLVLPTSLAAFALVVGQHGWGVLKAFDISYWPSLLISLVLLDLIIYGQHIVFHKIPVLWRLHRVHHADTEFDVTTALRFHPFEILLSMAIKFAAVAAIGTPPEAVILFETILNASAMFNHGNIKLPKWLDARLRYILVTPDMHRVHHSVIPRETNSNYGFSISLWDRMFGTYRPQPEHGHEDMTIGLKIFRDKPEATLPRLLSQPFRN